MLSKKNIKRTKRELKYIDVIANLIGLIEGFDCGGEFSDNTLDMLYNFGINIYELKLIRKVFIKLGYYTFSGIKEE